MSDPAASATREGPRSCDLRARRRKECGSLRPVTPCAERREVRCATCHVRGGPRTLCGTCGRVIPTARKLTSADPQPHDCWWEPIAICNRCAPRGVFTELRKGEPECLRCRLAGGLNELVSPTRPAPGWFAPLREAILTMPAPTSALTGVGPANRALWWLLSGDLPLTHEALDGLPQRRSIRHLRELLVSTGALPHRDPNLAGLEAVLEDRFGVVIPQQDWQALAAFGRWRILELARRARQRELTPAEIENDRARILGAARFLCWLERQYGSVDDLMQTDVDAWFAQRDNAKWRACDFLAWAVNRGIVSNTAGLLDARRLILPAAGEHRSSSADSGAWPP